MALTPGASRGTAVPRSAPGYRPLPRPGQKCPISRGQIDLLPSEDWTFFQKCSGRRPLLPLNALEGRQEVAQGKRGGRSDGTVVPPRAALGQRSDQFFSSPPESPAFGRFGGSGRERGPFVAEWRVSRFVVVQTFLSPKRDFRQ